VGYWHLFHKRFYTYLIDQNGLNKTPVVSPQLNGLDYLLDLCISPVGNRVVMKGVDTLSTKYYNATLGAWVYDSSEVSLYTVDFNNNLGIFNNYNQFYKFKNIHYIYGIGAPKGAHMAFSASGNYLYNINSKEQYHQYQGFSKVIDTISLNQFERSGSTYVNRTQIDYTLNTGLNNKFPLDEFQDIARGPDGKIYVIAQTYNVANYPGFDINVIHRPEKKGITCRYQKSYKDSIPIGYLHFPRLPPSSVSEAWLFHENACVKDTAVLWINDSTCIDSLKWDFGDPGSGALNTATGFKVGHRYNQVGKYNLKIVRFEGGIPDTLLKNIVVEGGDTVHIRSDTLLCAKDTLFIQPNLNNDYDFVWSTGSNDSAIYFSDSGWVWVDAFNKCVLTRDSMYVSYASTPKVDLPNDTAVCDSFPLSTSWARAKYSWSTGDSTTSIVPTTTKKYWVTAKNICGFDSDSINLEIHHSAQSNITDTTFCKGSSYKINLNFPHTIYWWSAITNKPYATYSKAGKHWVRTNNLCGVFRDTFEIKYTPNPNVDLGNDTTICSNLPLTLNAGAADTSLRFYWYHNGTIDSSVVVNTARQYKVEVKHECGRLYDSIRIDHVDKPDLLLKDTSICLGDSATLLASLGWKSSATNTSSIFIWSTGDTTSYASIKNYGKYWAKAENKCGSDSVDFEVTELQPVKINFPGDTIICDNNTLTLDAGNQRATYLWHNGSTKSSHLVLGSGTYSVRVENPCGFKSKSINVTHLKTPVALVNAEPNSRVCPGTPVTLLGRSGTDEGQYLWNTGDTSNTILVKEAGEYSLTVTNYCGSHSVKFNPAFFAIKAGFTLNKKESMIPLDLIGNNSSAGADQFIWLMDNKKIGEERDLTYRIIPFGDHVISLVAYDNYGCRDTVSDSIRVLPNPNIPPLLCDFRIDPNPAKDHFVITALNNDKQVREIKIFNDLSQVVYQSDISHWEENPFYFEHRFTNLPSGTYLVGLFCVSETKFKRIVVSE
tara:strand:+ start:266 stop:3256 length:2991 start_codon:yes stop_codon:yes gene_type:complete